MVEFMQCSWCKSREHLELKENHQYFDAALDSEVIGTVVVCNNCNTIHFPKGGFQIDVVPKEYEEHYENYV